MRRARIEIYRAEDLGDRDAARGPKLWRRPAGSTLHDARAPASRVVSRRDVLVAGARPWLGLGLGLGVGVGLGLGLGLGLGVGLGVGSGSG